METSISIPQPRYSNEHKTQAEVEDMPLFTFDIYWHTTRRRHTSTGVLNDVDAEHIIGIIRRSLQRKAASTEDKR